MAHIFTVVPATINTGDLTVSTTPPTNNTGSLVNDETDGVYIIPAGARNIRIENGGATSNGGVPATALVAGGPFSVGRILELNSANDLSGNQEIEPPSITIDGQGSMMFVSYMLP